MSKYFVTLSRLRHRFNKLLYPLSIKYEKTYNILNAPPYRKPKPSGKTKIEIVTHERENKLSR